MRNKASIPEWIIPKFRYKFYVDIRSENDKSGSVSINDFAESFATTASGCRTFGFNH